jgi:biopolymer transport protein ExbD
MRKRKLILENNGNESSIDITPMLDIVFIMLIFFIVTATFVKEAGIEVKQPVANTATSQNNANILVAIDSNNIIWIDKRQIDLRAVRPNIQRLHSLNPQGAVLIQADNRSNTETLISVMDETRAAGVSDIAISTEKLK